MTPYIQIALFSLGLVIGGWLEHEFHLASQTAQAYHDLSVAQTGEANIVKETQIIVKDIHNDKDPCLNDPVPADLNKRLH